MIQHVDLLEWNGSHGFRFTHDFFKFPGKFHPPLVEHILRSINPRGVIDPMAGIGTVAVEAKTEGVPSMSIDVDPVSVFFTRVKTTPIPEKTLHVAWKNLSASLERFRRDGEEIEERKFRDIRADVLQKNLSRVNAKNLERLTYWFRRYVLVDYAKIDHTIFNGGLPGYSKAVRRFFHACLLSSIRRISNADPSPVSGLEITKHMKEKIERGYEIDVFGEFERRVELSVHRMGKFTNYLQDKGTYYTPVYTRQADCIDLLRLRKPSNFRADLIFFSPPYCNAIEYWRRHRLEYLLGRFLNEEGIAELKRSFVGKNTVGVLTNNLPALGFPPIDTLISTLCSEGRTHKAKLLWQYFDDMRRRLKVFYEALPPDGHCVMVVGDSQTSGKNVPTVKTLTWLGQRVGFEHLKTSEYDIKNRVMQFPLKSHSKIQKEAIIVLHRSS